MGGPAPTDLTRRPLCVLTRALGQPSETFIRRHVTDLAPGRTCVVTRYGQRGQRWGADGPQLVLQPEGARPSLRVVLGRGTNILRSLPARHWSLSGAQIRTTLGFLEQNGVEVVLAEYLDLWVDLVEPIASRGHPFFVHGHGYDMSEVLRDPRWSALYREYRSVNGIIVPSQAAKRRLGSIGLPESRIHVIPYGVEVPDEPPSHREDVIADRVRCLAVGRLVDKKAPLNTLKAFAAAHRRAPQLQLDMVGDGPLYASVAGFVAHHGLDSAVRLHGAQDHDRVLSLLRESDLFLQHSVRSPTGDEEGLPVAILEAMAAGVPIIATRHAGIPEAVVHGDMGMLVEEQDIEGMADAIVELAQDQTRRRSMAWQAWAAARDRYSWSRERADLLGVLGLPR